jgi:hypothetical protein
VVEDSCTLARFESGGVNDGLERFHVAAGNARAVVYSYSDASTGASPPPHAALINIFLPLSVECFLGPDCDKAPSIWYYRKLAFVHYASQWPQAHVSSYFLRLFAFFSPFCLHVSYSASMADMLAHSSLLILNDVLWFEALRLFSNLTVLHMADGSIEIIYNQKTDSSLWSCCCPSFR